MKTREQLHLLTFFDFLDRMDIIDLEDIDLDDSGGARVTYVDSKDIGFSLSAFRNLATALGMNIADATYDPEEPKVVLVFEPKEGKQ